MTGKGGWLRGNSLALAGALAVTLASSGSAPAAAAGRRPAASVASLGAGQTGPRSAVPWREVGPGWVLAEYWPGRYEWEAKPRAAAATLYLIDPAGGRYRLYRWPVTKNPPFLVDWSGDKSRALVSSSGPLEQVVLATGKISRFRLPGEAQVIAYTRPSGQGLLGWRQVGSRTQLARYRLTGELAKVLISDTSTIAAVYSSKGSALAVGGPHGVLLVSNRGGVIRGLPVPGVRGGCAPSRWWNSRVILAWCRAASSSRSRLWLVPVSGARPSALTAQRGRRSPDPGDIGAWQVRGRLYLQALAPSGIARIFRQPANGQVAAVTVPHTAGDNWILAARGPRLLLAAEQDPCDDSNTSLTWFNPVTRREQMLIRTPHALAGVLGAVPYGQPLAPIFFAVGCAGASMKRAGKPGVDIADLRQTSSATRSAGDACGPGGVGKRLRGGVPARH